MFAYAASTATQHPFGEWSLLFARQPEPDLDFEEDLAEDTQQIGGQSPGPGKPPKKKGTSPFLWILLVALLGAGGYFAMDPDGFMGFVNSLMGEASPPVAQTPPPTRPPSDPMAAQKPVAGAPPPSTPGAGAPSAVTPGPTTAPGQAAPPTPPPTMPTPSTPLTAKVTTPLFAEGQRVTTAGIGATTLTQNSVGSVPGPAVKPGSTLVVLDGELQPSGWVYHVRTESGAKGWIPEAQLRATP